MKYKIYDNKKGIGIDDAVPLIIFIFVAAIGIFLFRVNENIKSNKLIEDIQTQKDIIEGHEVLISYLRKIDEQGNSKADSISKLVIEKNYEILKKDLTDYFGKRLEYLNWYIEVKESSGKLLFPALANAQYSPQEQYSSTQVAHLVASVLVSISNKDHILIELFFAR